MTIYRFISTKPEGSESGNYNATIVDARDRGAAQKTMTNRLAMNETVVSVNSLESGHWIALEGRTAIQSSQLSLHPNCMTELPWDGDVLHHEAANDHVRQPAKTGGEKSLQGTLTQVLDSNEKPLVVVVMYFVTTIFALGGLIGLFAMPFRNMDIISSIAMLLALFSPALVAWIVTVSLTYLAGIHDTVKKMEILQRSRS